MRKKNLLFALTAMSGIMLATLAEPALAQAGAHHGPGPQGAPQQSAPIIRNNPQMQGAPRFDQHQGGGVHPGFDGNRGVGRDPMPRRDFGDQRQLDRRDPRQFGGRDQTQFNQPDPRQFGGRDQRQLDQRRPLPGYGRDTLPGPDSIDRRPFDGRDAIDHRRGFGDRPYDGRPSHFPNGLPDRSMRPLPRGVPIEVRPPFRAPDYGRGPDVRFSRPVDRPPHLPRIGQVPYDSYPIAGQYRGRYHAPDNCGYYDRFVYGGREYRHQPFFAYRQYAPTAWFFFGRGVWYGPDYGYQYRPPVYDGPITVVVEESEWDDQLGEFVEATWYYNAYFYPEEGAYGYYDLHGEFRWVRW